MLPVCRLGGDRTLYSRPVGESVDDRLEDLQRIAAQRSRDAEQLKHVNSALTSFIGRHEGLRLSKPLRDILLCQSRISPQPGETLADNLVLIRVNPHARAPTTWSAGSLDRKSRY